MKISCGTRGRACSLASRVDRVQGVSTQPSFHWHRSPPWQPSSLCLLGHRVENGCLPARGFCVQAPQINTASSDRIVLAQREWGFLWSQSPVAGGWDHSSHMDGCPCFCAPIVERRGSLQTKGPLGEIGKLHVGPAVSYARVMFLYPFCVHLS